MKYLATAYDTTKNILKTAPVSNRFYPFANFQKENTSGDYIFLVFNMEKLQDIREILFLLRTMSLTSKKRKGSLGNSLTQQITEILKTVLDVSALDPLIKLEKDLPTLSIEEFIEALNELIEGFGHLVDFQNAALNS